MKKKISQLQAGNEVDSAFERTDWQSAFIEALQMELHDYRKILYFDVENKLTKEPLRVDCIVIKKTKNAKISKNIAAFFREWNLFEYKGPGDYVSVADFYKVYSYACLYASIHKVPITSLTVSFVERRFPRKLIRHLQEVRGYTVAETTEGIYTVSGDILPVQIIDSRKLPADENLWLKSLSDRLSSLEFTRIGEEIARQKKDTQITAYLNVITDANTESIQEAMDMRKKITFQQVCEKVGLNVEWEARGEARGKARGKAEIARKMKEMGDSVERIHTITGLSPETVRKL